MSDASKGGATEEDSAEQRIDSAGSDDKVVSFQDIGCLNRPKYVYKFANPIEDAISLAFADCAMRRFKFSEFVPLANDILKIKRTEQFEADFIIGGVTATVYFAGTSASPPMPLVNRFDTRLLEAGYGRVRRLAAQRPHCERCPVASSKKCAAMTALP